MSVVSEEGQPGEIWRCTATNGNCGIWKICDAEEISELKRSGRITQRSTGPYVYAMEFSVNKRPEPAFSNLKPLSSLGKNPSDTWERISVATAEIFFPSYEFSE